MSGLGNLWGEGEVGDFKARGAKASQKDPNKSRRPKAEPREIIANLSRAKPHRKLNIEGRMPK